MQGSQQRSRIHPVRATTSEELKMRSTVLFASIIALVGCMQPAGEIAKSEAPILYGEASGPDQDMVVTVGSRQGLFLCTGTLLAPNLVLTGRHCVSRQLSQEGYACTPDGTLTGNGGLLGADFTPSL